MAEDHSLLMRDVSHAGHELGRARLEGLPAELTLGELLQRRVHADVERFHARSGTVFAGLVAPPDAIRHSDGHHLPAPRRLDADRMVAAAEEAVDRGLLWLAVEGGRVAELEGRIAVEGLEEVTAVLRRSVVAADA